MIRNRSTTSSLAAVLAILAALPAHADVLEKTKKIGNITVHYKVVLRPPIGDAAKTYPRHPRLRRRAADHEHCGRRHRRNFRAEAEKRGYIVIVPAAPDGRSCSSRAESASSPNSLKQILADYKIRDNKFHIAGVSNGGRMHFRISRGLAESRLLPFHYRFPRLSVGGNSGARPSHLQNVHPYVRRRSRPHGLAASDAETDRGISRQRHDRDLYRRKGPAPPYRHPRRPWRRPPLLRSLRSSLALQPRLRKVTVPGAGCTCSPRKYMRDGHPEEPTA